MEEKKPNVLVIDDDEAVARLVRRSISNRLENCELHLAHNIKDALILANRIKPEVVVLDLALENDDPNSGLSMIPKLYSIDDSVSITVLTGNSEGYWGEKSIEAGAANFLIKPANADGLATFAASGITKARLIRSSRQRSGSSIKTLKELGFSTKSPAMAVVLDEIELAAITEQPVLLFGETGVGKTYIANLLHKAGPRRDKPFVRTQPTCGSQDLVMSELFGHVKGAYTGASETRKGKVEEADRGTLFIDEIDQFSREVQVALLHVLQSKEFHPVGSNVKKSSDFRLISATNYPDEHLVSDNQMREDFYHRIAKLKICIPPLRDRVEDIPDIATSILSRLTANDKGYAIRFSREALGWLSGQKWKGNIRELESAVEIAYSKVKHQGRSRIGVSDLTKSNFQRVKQSSSKLAEQLKAYEYNIAWMEFSNNMENYSATARSLGIDRKRLRKILLRFGGLQND